MVAAHHPHAVRALRGTRRALEHKIRDAEHKIDRRARGQKLGALHESTVRATRTLTPARPQESQGNLPGSTCRATAAEGVHGRLLAPQRSRPIRVSRAHTMLTHRSPHGAGGGQQKGEREHSGRASGGLSAHPYAVQPRPDSSQLITRSMHAIDNLQLHGGSNYSSLLYSLTRCRQRSLYICLYRGTTRAHSHQRICCQRFLHT